MTTDLQALGLIVTAEPYYSVTQPSDVVVLENVVRPDTIGMRETVTARYDLLPRGGYVMNVQHGQLQSIGAEAARLPYDRYEALLELYQAENAVQIARSIGADRLAPESFGKASTLLENARDFQARKQDTHMIVSTAREAAQMAEDARSIAVKRRDEERQREALQSQDQGQARIRAEADAELARAQALAEQVDAERAAAERQREQEAQREAARRPAVQPPPPIEAKPLPHAEIALTGEQRRSRADLLERLNAVLQTRDTPRGLIVIVPDSLFEPEHGSALRPSATERLMMVAAVQKAYPDLTARVEGHTDDRISAPEAEGISQSRAQAVRDALVRNGFPSHAVVATGYGKSRPIASNATADGREQNQRVEIVLSGPRIGEMPLWERTYSLKP